MMFEPKSIAVIGASSTSGKVGYDIFKNLLEDGYEGKVYPVNPKHDEIQGMKAYKSVTEIPEDVEMAVVVIPAKFVPAVIEECGTKKVKTVVVISAGFSEVHTEEGQQLEDAVVAAAKKHSIALVGPNCLGVLRPSIGMNASFATDIPKVGNVALISQSGAMAVALMDASPALDIGYSAVISIGNKSVLDECDFLEQAAEDGKTSVIGFYLESIKDGDRFKEIAARVTKDKHIILLKSGVSEHGKKAAASHTGALAGSDAAIEAVCTQTGMHRAHTAQEFLDLIQVLSTQPVLLSPKVAIITNAGGPGILATDAAEKAGLTLQPLTERTESVLREKLTSAAATGNPIDLIGDAGTDRYIAALEACGDDPEIDGVCVLLTPQVMTPCEEIAQAIVEWKKKYPMIPVTTSFMGSDSVQEARALLRANSIPTFETPERAVAALAALQIHSSNLKTKNLAIDEKRAKKAGAILQKYKGLLPESAAEELFALYDLPVPKSDIAKDAPHAIEIAKDIGLPVIAKISAPDILHKTDVGGIKANLETEEEVEEAYNEIMESVTAAAPLSEIRGILIQQFLPIGSEFIVGIIRDPSFGPLVMVGLGGIYTELFRDTSFRIAPVSDKEPYEMLQELTAWKLLLGMRGKKQLAIDDLADLVASISQMATECPQIKELDINPVLVGEGGIVIADAKVVID